MYAWGNFQWVTYCWSVFLPIKYWMQEGVLHIIMFILWKFAYTKLKGVSITGWCIYIPSNFTDTYCNSLFSYFIGLGTPKVRPITQMVSFLSLLDKNLNRDYSSFKWVRVCSVGWCFLFNTRRYLCILQLIHKRCHRLQECILFASKVYISWWFVVLLVELSFALLFTNGSS